MSAARPPPLVLMPRQHRASAAERWAIAGLWTVILGGFLTMLFLVFGGLFDMDPDALAKTLTRFPDKLREDPIHFVELVSLPFVAAVHIWFSRRRARLERVFLDQTGIRYQSPLPEALRLLGPSWSLQWSQLRELRVALPGSMFHPNLVLLEFDAGQVKRKLPQALLWVPADAAGQAAFSEEPVKPERFFTLRLSTPDREETLRRVEQSPIVRYARQVGAKVSTGAMRQTGFALESNRHTLAAAILGISLLVYGFVDIALYDESYAVDPPFVLFALGGALAALAGMLWLASVRAPRAETLGLALLLGGATGVALYPGTLRLNAATDSEGLHAYEYRLTRYSVFEPVDQRLPTLDFSEFSDYWGQFKLGTTHQFELRKGGLGFYQVNMAPVRERMRAYFRGRN
jgi:hypothetical protein